MSKTILITGSGSGPGNGIAGALSDEGHGVIAAVEIIGEYIKNAADELGSTPNIEVISFDLNNSLNHPCAHGIPVLIPPYKTRNRQ